MHRDQRKKMYVVLHEFSSDICSYSQHQTADNITMTCCPQKVRSGEDSKIQRISYEEANHEVITTADQNTKYEEKNGANCYQRGKLRMTKPLLVLVLPMIGSDSGLNYLDQSQSEVKRTKCNPGFLFHTQLKLLESFCRVIPQLVTVTVLSRWLDFRE